MPQTTIKLLLFLKIPLKNQHFFFTIEIDRRVYKSMRKSLDNWNWFLFSSKCWTIYSKTQLRALNSFTIVIWTTRKQRQFINLSISPIWEGKYNTFLLLFYFGIIQNDLNDENGNNSTNNSTKNVDIQFSAHNAFLE